MKRAFLIAFVALACNRAPEEHPSTSANDTTQTTVVLTSQQQQAIGITLDSLRQGTLERTLDLRGTIELPPQNRIYISFPLQAIVRSINGLVGMYVRRGTVLAKLESMQLVELQERFLATRAQVERLLREYERQRTLVSAAATTDRAVLETQTQLRELQIALAAYRERLRIVGIEPARLADTGIVRTITLTAPRDAYIAAINVAIGQTVDPNTRILELVDISDVHLVLRAYEQDAPLIQPGQRIVTWAIADSAHAYPAEVVAVSHTLDSTRTIELHCHFDRYDHARLRPGMYMRARLSVGSVHGFLVPLSAVVAWDNQHGVFVPDGNGYRFVRTLLQASDGERAIITFESTTPPSTLVVTRGAYWLLMKLRNNDVQEE